MMKFAVLVALMAITVYAYPQAELVKSNVENQPDGYTFEYALSDDTHRSETAKQNTANPDPEHQGVEIQGEYGHKTPEGRTLKVIYTAGEKGFLPKIIFS